MSQQNHRARFESIVHSEDDLIRIDEAALAIAAETDPDTDIEQSLARLDRLAEKFESMDSTGLGISVARLIEFIHEDEKFSGNLRDYYDPANSYLNRVLESKIGIPISLAIIHLALGQRLNIPVSGVNFPGHFLIKYGDEKHLFVDPFSGRILSEPDCGTLLRQMAGPKAVLQSHYFDAASNKAIMIRILDNLKQIFWRKKQWDLSKLCIERQQIIRPDENEYDVQLGAVYEMQGNINLAHLTYSSIVEHTDDDQMRALASKRLLAMRSGSPTVH